MWSKLYFQHHYSSLQCHMIFRNHNNMLICCSRNISDYYQCWKQLCCPIFLWKPWHLLFFRILWWIESSKEKHLFEIEIFCYIINAFTVTFDQFNESLLNKSIHFFQKQYLQQEKSVMFTKPCDSRTNSDFLSLYSLMTLSGLSRPFGCFWWSWAPETMWRWAAVFTVSVQYFPFMIFYYISA